MTIILTKYDQLRPISALRRWLAGTLWDREQAQADFDRQHEPRSFLYRAHLAASLYWCFAVGLPTSLVEFALLPVFVCAVLRAGLSWRIYKEFLTQPLVIFAGCFLLWHAASLFWTTDFSQGVKQAGQARWAWTAVAFWSVIKERRWLIAALAIGLLLGNASQAAHAIGTHWHIDLLRFDRAPDRNSGWWKPVVGGSMLVGALGLHLPAALRGVGRARWLGIGGSAVTLVGIFATGSRGAWIAATLLALIAAGVSIAAAKHRRRALLAVGTAAAVVGIALAAAGPRISPAIERRIELAKADVHAALDRGDYASDTGARIAMAVWAVQAFKAHPIIGVGAGGYQAWVQTQQAASPPPPPSQNPSNDPAKVPIQGPVHAHAHNAILHIAATTGLVGVVLALASLALAFRNAAVLATLAGGGHSAGPFYALLGLALVSPFDPVHINSQTAALMMTLFALCPSWIPRAGAPNAPTSTGTAAP